MHISPFHLIYPCKLPHVTPLNNTYFPFSPHSKNINYPCHPSQQCLFTPLCTSKIPLSSLSTMHSSPFHPIPKYKLPLVTPLSNAYYPFSPSFHKSKLLITPLSNAFSPPSISVNSPLTLSNMFISPFYHFLYLI